MTSARIALRLALGILCGVVLVALPAVFSAGTPAASPNTYKSGNSTIFGPAIAAPLGFTRAPSMDGLALLGIVLFIFLPSTVFSIIVRRWAEKRAREYL